MAALQISIHEFPLSAHSLVRLLREGKEGHEDKFSDEAIANWCYELFTAIDGNLYLGDLDIPASAVRNVAYDVSLQWEADFGNASGRVLSPDLFQSWLLQLGQGDA